MENKRHNLLAAFLNAIGFELQYHSDVELCDIKYDNLITVFGHDSVKKVMDSYFEYKPKYRSYLFSKNIMRTFEAIEELYEMLWDVLKKDLEEKTKMPNKKCKCKKDSNEDFVIPMLNGKPCSVKDIYFEDFTGLTNTNNKLTDKEKEEIQKKLNKSKYNDRITVEVTYDYDSLCQYKAPIVKRLILSSKEIIDGLKNNKIFIKGMALTEIYNANKITVSIPIKSRESATIKSDFETDKNFHIGDLVELKSSGPTMTIINIFELSAECSWFDDENILYKETFRIDSLKKINNME